jgi:ferric-dicitrate binding protein FerR (iron transport regulator)
MSTLDQPTLETLAAYAAGDLSDHQRGPVEALLATSSEARATVDRLTALAAAAAGTLPLALDPAARERIGLVLDTAFRRARRRRRMALGATAAVAAAIAVALAWAPSNRQTPPLAGGDSQRIVTEPGGYRLVTLGDRGVAFVGVDSEVQLGAGGALALRIDRGSVRLVVRRGIEPLIIATPAADVEVLGTELDVSVLAAGTEVRVVRGQVLVRNQHGQRLLWAQEIARVRPGETPRFYEPSGPLGLRQPD